MIRPCIIRLDVGQMSVCIDLLLQLQKILNDL